MMPRAHPGEGAIEGDPLGQLFDEMVDDVYAYAVVRLGRSDAEEVTGDVFCAAADCYRRGNADQVTPAWLMAVARNKVIDRWRSLAARSAKNHLIWADAEIGALERWSDAGDTELALAALERLDRFDRMMLVLRYVEGHPVPEIAARIGRTTTATASALARSRRKLRKTYESEAQKLRGDLE